VSVVRPNAGATAEPLRVELRQGSGGVAVLALSGRLDVSTAAAARDTTLERLAGFRGTALEVDASGIERGDVSGLSLLYELAGGRLASGVRARITGLRPELGRLLAVFPTEGAFALLEGAPPTRPGDRRPIRFA